MNNQIVVYSDNGTPLDNKKESITVTHKSMHKSQKHVERKTLDMKEYRLYNCTYMTF